MGLQVRVKHALGSRLIDLPDRTLDNPITVGRAAGAEVQVPSVSVAARHCVMFRYEGRWVVQDVQAANGAGTTGTFVNGQQVVDPVMLQVGDVISIGSEAKAPTIEVDPAAAAEGRTGWAGDEMTAAPMVPGYAAPAGHGASGPYAGSPGYVSTSGVPGGYRRAGPAAPAPAAWGGSGAPGNGDLIDLSGAASQPSSTPSYRRKKKPQNSPVAIMIGAAVSVAIISLTAWWVVSHQQHEIVIVAPKPKAEEVHHLNNIFDMGSGSVPDHTSEPTAPRPAVAPQPAAPDETDTAAPANPGKRPASTVGNTTPGTPVAGPKAPASAMPGPQDMAPPKPSNPKPAAPIGPTDEWLELQQLHDGQTEPALAIFRFSDYQKHHAGQHTDDLQRYMDDKFDRLWWDRIEQLFKKSDRLVKDAKDKQDQIFDETDKDMKKQEQDELAKLKAAQKLTKEIITARMGYAETQPPPAGGAELAALREKRDKAKYAEWKRTTLNSIINNKGKTDWEGDN